MLFPFFKKKPRSFICLNAHIRWLANCYARAAALRNVSPNKTSWQAGFTLLEMLVVIAITTIMTGVLLSNLPSFRDLTTLQLMAQEVAITIRSAQVFGIGTKVSNGNFNNHGIYFCNPELVGGSPLCRKNFALFSDDITKDRFFTDVGASFPGTCDSSAASECLESYKIGGNIDICKIMVKNSSSPVLDDLIDTGLSITFSRLYPDAFIYSDASMYPGDGYEYAEIYLRSKRENRQRRITVYNTGGITVTTVPKGNPVCQ